MAFAMAVVLRQTHNGKLTGAFRRENVHKTKTEDS
jgi:hypothetical protein